MRRRALGVFLSTTLLVLSVLLLSTEGTITTEVWALLLLIPLPVAIALSPENDEISDSDERRMEWDDGETNTEHSEVADPLDSGFDIPIL